MYYHAHAVYAYKMCFEIVLRVVHASQAVIYAIHEQALRWMITISPCRRTCLNRTRGSKFLSTMAMIVFFACLMAHLAMVARFRFQDINCTTVLSSGSANSSFTDEETSLSTHWY